MADVLKNTELILKVEIEKELARATAPRKLLGEKDKAELLEVIIRIEGVVTGLMKKYKDDIPKILRTEE